VPFIAPPPGGEHPVHHHRQVGGAVHDGRVDHLAAAGGLGVPQRGEQPDRQVEGSPAEVADQVERDLRRAGGRPDGVQDAGDGQVGDVVAGARGERAVLPPAGHPPVHQAGVALPARLRADAEPLGHPGPEALDDDVRAGGQGEGQVDAGGLLQVGGDRPLAAVQQILPVVGVPGGRGPGPVQADHVGAEVGQQHGAERAGADAAELDDAYPAERSGGGRHPYRSAVLSRSSW
jgi:hypothetical protein